MEKMVRENKTAVINLRVTPQVKNDLQVLAQQEGISVAKLIGRAVDDYATHHTLRSHISALESTLVENGLSYDDERKLSEIGLERLVGVLNGIGVEDGDQLVKLIELAGRK